MIANRYSLEREIGRGGMGAVWLGRDEVLGRRVAVKQVGRAPGGGSDQETDQQRAEREARIAASLSHPHVVAIFDLVEDGGDQWLVMEYVEGRSLSQVVREDGALPHSHAAAYLADAAAALAVAHAEGVVHRDVKPSNILLTDAGEAKLLDFGIAKAQGDLTLTRTGLVSGSPAYLAPEVASGLPATTASDVWSLGATLFHLLTGRPPYDVGDNIVGGLYRIVHEEPPVVEDAGWLAPLLGATMVRDPDQRWSMARVAAYLEAGPGDGADDEGTRVLAPLPAAGAAVAGAAAGSGAAEPTGDATPADRGAPDPATPTAPPSARDRRAGAGRSRRGLLVLAGVVVLLLVAIAAFWLQPDEQEAGVPEAQAPSPAAEPSSEDPSDDPTPEGPTERGMGRFIRDYLRTAAADAPAGFAMLTPSFQQQSGGIGGYEGFWGQVEGVQDVEIAEVDTEALTVGYTYTYRTTDGREIPDSVTLQLSYDADQDRYLIADEA